MYGWVDLCIVVWMHECADGWIDVCVDGYIDRKMYGQIDEIDKRMNGIISPKKEAQPNRNTPARIIIILFRKMTSS